MPVFLRWFLRLVPLNPIAVRLVGNGSKRQMHNFIRSLYLALLILVLLGALLRASGWGAGGPISYRALAEAGAQSFVVIAYLQIVLICILAPVFMAGAIAQESNPKTWDIILTTPLTTGQIVLGNLFGRLLFVIGLLGCSLPLFAITQYFGGVPARSIFASYGIAASAAFLVGSIAIALAVSRVVGKRAVFTFYTVVVTYIAVTAALDTLSGSGRVTYWTGVNPFLALRALLNPATYPRAEAGSLGGFAGFMLESPVTAWCVLSSTVSVMLLVVSTFTVRLGGLQTVASKGSGVPWYRKMMGLGAADAEFRPPRVVGTNPISWREATARNSTFWRIMARWSFVAFGALGGLALVLVYHLGGLRTEVFRQILMATVWTESAVILLIAINMAATAVSREREDGTLDLLLTTPITPTAYLSGKLKGLIAYLLPMLAVPIWTLLVAGVYVLADGFGSGVTTVSVATSAYTGSVSVPIVLPEAGLLAALVLIPFTSFCVMVGLNWSLKSKGTIGSVVATVGVVGVVGGIAGLCGWQAGTELEMVGPGLSSLTPVTLLFAAVLPEQGMRQTIQYADTGVAAARLSLAVGSVLTAGVYLGVVFGIRATMVRGFDFTVRKLAGTK